MQVLMKYSGVSQKCHVVSDDQTPLCGCHHAIHTWGVFEIPDAMLEVLPICGLCNQKLHPQASNLRERCAAHGWELRIAGVGYELIGNGAPAVFTSEESLVVWLDRQEKSHATTATTD